jgi:NitT/TauT family transport system permease protein
VSIKLIDEPPSVVEAIPSRPVAVRGMTAPAGFSALAILAPAVAALAALIAHRFIPNAQAPMTWMTSLAFWLHPYPMLLSCLLALSLVAALVQWLWRPFRSWVVHYGPLLAGLLLVLGIWDLLTLKLDWLSLPFFPGPDQILGSMMEDSHLLLESTWHSLMLLLSGYFTGVVAGLVTGVVIGWFPRVRYWGMPVLKIIGPIPATALIPTAMTLFPGSFACGSALIGFAVWFPVTMLTASGIANVRLSYLDVARTLGAGRLYLIFRVAIPAAMPNIFLGLFMGLGASFLAIIVAEGVGVAAGLGWYLKWKQGYVEYAHVYGSLVIMAVFFSTMMTILFKVRDQVLKWQKGVIKW